MARALDRRVLPERRAWAEQSRREQRPPALAAERWQQQRSRLQARRQPVFQQLRWAVPLRVASRME